MGNRLGPSQVFSQVGPGLPSRLSCGPLVSEPRDLHRFGDPRGLLGRGANRMGVNLCRYLDVLVADVAAGGGEIDVLEQVRGEGVAEIVRADVAEARLLGGD